MFYYFETDSPDCPRSFAPQQTTLELASTVSSQFWWPQIDKSPDTLEVGGYFCGGSYLKVQA